MIKHVKKMHEPQYREFLEKQRRDKIAKLFPPQPPPEQQTDGSEEMKY